MPPTLMCPPTAPAEHVVRRHGQGVGRKVWQRILTPAVGPAQQPDGAVDHAVPSGVGTWVRLVCGGEYEEGCGRVCRRHRQDDRDAAQRRRNDGDPIEAGGARGRAGAGGSDEQRACTPVAAAMRVWRVWRGRDRGGGKRGLEGLPTCC
eukprot:141771-Chlamydomonas_euryale.AAC.3